MIVYLIQFNMYQHNNVVNWLRIFNLHYLGYIIGIEVFTLYADWVMGVFKKQP